MKRSSKRTDRVKYVDPVTGLTEYRYVEKVTHRYEDEEKGPIVIEFLTYHGHGKFMCRHPVCVKVSGHVHNVHTLLNICCF